MLHLGRVEEIPEAEQFQAVDEVRLDMKNLSHIVAQSLESQGTKTKQNLGLKNLTKMSIFRN